MTDKKRPEDMLRQAVATAIYNTDYINNSNEIINTSKIQKYISQQADFFEKQNYTLAEIAEIGRIYLAFATLSITENATRNTPNKTS